MIGGHGTIFLAVPRDTRDDGFHEIQLNGKQLVFLFMAATVVSVVIFLCGVLVGRGAGTGTQTVVEVAPRADELVDGSSSETSAELAADVPDSGPTTSGTAEEVPDLFDRLEGEPPEEQLRPRAAGGESSGPTPEPAVAVDPVSTPPPRLETAPPTVEAEAVAPAPALTPGDWAVQIAALDDSGDAELMARQWDDKGYDAYVVTPSNGTPAVYRVRIGSFQTRQEADALASKLQQEERISPWVTR